MSDDQRTGHELVTIEPTSIAIRQSAIEPWADIRIPCAVVRNTPVFPVSTESIGKIAPAFAQAQGQFKTAKRDSENPGFQGADKRAARYADLAAVHEACMEALNRNGLSVVHLTVPIGDEIYLLTRLLHESGEWLQSAFPLSTLDSVRQSIADAAKAPAQPAGGGLDSTSGDAPKKKRAPGVQALGSEITYLRRYCLTALVGVATEDDDDGNAAQAYQSRPTPAAAPAAAPARKPGGGL